jgi:hypothetical protein
MGELSQAHQDFIAARQKAFWNKLLSFLSGRPSRLLSWDEVCDELQCRGRIYRGVQSVPLDRIIGSVGRYKDFDRAFMPTQDTTARRWRSIASAYYDGVSLPPVQLYKIGDAYFVLDGHHRVSVAREQGFKSLEAEVTEAESRVPVTAELDADDLEIKGEYARFLERTRLEKLRPDQSIEFSIAGGYERLLEHIALHRHFVGIEQQRTISEDEAVRDWYDSVYTPVVDIIRERDILADFPGRTEADLYLWIMDHQHYLRERLGPGVETAEAAEHYADHYATHPIKRLLHAIRRVIHWKDEGKEHGAGESYTRYRGEERSALAPSSSPPPADSVVDSAVDSAVGSRRKNGS